MVTKKTKKAKKKSPPDRRTGSPATGKHLPASGDAQAGKRAGSIPGVDVGDVVDTSLGPKKKVCFNIGGKWFFRMVDPGWRAPGRPPKGKGRRG